MASSMTKIGNFPERQSGFHTCSPVSPSTVSETECSQHLFQQPPFRLAPPLFFTEGRSRLTDFTPSRQYWQQDLYRREEHELPLQAEYDIFGRLESARNFEGPPVPPRSFVFFREQVDSVLYLGLQREEDDVVLSLYQHSRVLPGVFGQPSTPMSEEYVHSSGLQDHSYSPESVSEAPIASSSRSSTVSTSGSTRSATGNYSQYSNMDTSVDMAGFTQNDSSHPSGIQSVPYGTADREAWEKDEGSSGGPVRSKKQRTGKGRERVRIALAPDQPPTTQGKPRERVYVACQQCRNRKIRCDGAKPMCYNCNQRGTGICEFDPLPKRRGPDRQPGARQRHGKVPGPRRRKSTKIDKEEVPLQCQEDVPFLSVQPASQPIVVQSNDRDSIWARIPSPSSSSSPNEYKDGQEQVTPGSSGSDASQLPHDYRSLLTPSFAFNAPREGYTEAFFRHDPDPPAFISRASTDPVVYSASSVLASGLSPEMLKSIPYSTITNPFSMQSDGYANIPSTVASEETSTIPDDLLKHGGPVPSASVAFNDYVPCELNIAQPVAMNRDPNISVAYSGIASLVPQASETTDYSIYPDSRMTNPRRSSLANVSSDSYNPYQWAVNQGQGQDIYDAYITSSEGEDCALPYEFTISQTPSLDFVRKTWWDALLDTYCAEPYYTPFVAAHYAKLYGVTVVASGGMCVGSADRQSVAQIILRDLQAAFKDSQFWFSFFNVPLFFGTFFRARETMQPALIFALLMWSNYMRSSVIGLASEGMRRTIWLKEAAQAALDASVSASWIDLGLAQAAWLIALFETSSHPARSVARLHSAFGTLDNIIRALSLAFIDAQDPSILFSSDATSPTSRSSSLTNSTVSHVLPLPLYNRQPIASDRPKSRRQSQLLQYHSLRKNSLDPRRGTAISKYSAERATCSCNALSLGKNWPEAKEHVPFWLYSPAWKPTWSDAEVRREECRRLCWNTLHLFANYTTYRTSVGLNTLDLFLLHPSNVHNIFPGENLTDLLPSSSTVSKLDTVWALYARAILLWHACLRIRNVSERERAMFAQSVWLEADAIENALDGHSCDTERAFLYHGREYLVNARMYVSSEFRRFVPHPSADMSGAVHRRKAEEFLTHQETLAKRCMHSFQALTGFHGLLLAKRPFFCYWFMGHLSRCLRIWQADKTMTVALEVAKNFLSPINYLSALWPCDEQRMSYAAIRQQLENACLEAGVALPPPIDPSFPYPMSSNSLV